MFLYGNNKLNIYLSNVSNILVILSTSKTLTTKRRLGYNNDLEIIIIIIFIYNNKALIFCTVSLPSCLVPIFFLTISLKQGENATSMLGSTGRENERKD